QNKPVRPSDWLDAQRPVEQMIWHPAEPELIQDRLLHVAGWVRHPGARAFNLYRPPAPIAGNPRDVGPWLDHVHKVYPEDADHLIAWLAHRVQRPGEKVNHGIVLAGAP